MKFGKDIQIAPKKANVSIRRKKQFALLQPATKSRFEFRINQKGQAPDDRIGGYPLSQCHVFSLNQPHPI
ncbi:MAG: hypothetical protein WD398_06235 [Cyclobacteriaceae bacterium]